jgi:hypothetical protein
MDFKDKYLKYKEKYLKLKNQIGSGRFIKSSTYNIEIDQQLSKNIEIYVNRISNNKEIDEETKKIYTEIGDFLYNFKDDSAELELSEDYFNIINSIIKKIKNYRISKINEKKLNELLGINEVTTVADDYELVDKTSFFKYEYIKIIPDSIKVTEIDNLFSLLFSLNKDQSFSNSTVYISYFIPRPELIEIRLNFLRDSGIQNPVSHFNQEKKEIIDNYNKLKIYIDENQSFETLFIKSLTIDYSKSDGHTNIGIIKLNDNHYFYKQLNFILVKLIDSSDLLRNYKFINDCNNFNIDNEYTYDGNKYKLHFVKVFLKVIFSFDFIKDVITIGYLMEIVEGDTISKIKNEGLEYWESNKNLIKTALRKLVYVLTEKNFYILDLHNDNVMWNKKTNTLTYIDINVNSFIQPGRAADFNASLYDDIDKI